MAHMILYGNAIDRNDQSLTPERYRPSLRSQETNHELVHGENGHVDREGAYTVEQESSKQDGGSFAGDAFFYAVDESFVASLSHAVHL